MKGCGVIVWQDRLTYYEPGEAGVRAYFVGEAEELAVTPELSAAILADLEHQACKTEQP